MKPMAPRFTCVTCEGTDRQDEMYQCYYCHLPAHLLCRVITKQFVKLCPDCLESD